MKRLLLLALLIAQAASISADAITLTTGSNNKKSFTINADELIEKLKKARPVIDMALAGILLGYDRIYFARKIIPYNLARLANYSALLSLAEHGYSNLPKDNLLKTKLKEQLQKITAYLNKK